MAPSRVTHKDAVEKVTPLRRNLVFLATGVDHIYEQNGKTSIKLDGIAIRLTGAETSKGMLPLAFAFAKHLDQELSKLPQPEVANLYRVNQKLGAGKRRRGSVCWD